MLRPEAQEFVDKEIFESWPKWAPSYEVREIWVDAFWPYSYDDAHACFVRYYTTEETKFKPSIKAVLSYMVSSDGKVANWVWIQNERSGVFNDHYYSGDKEKVINRLFRKFYTGGHWRSYDSDKITHTELAQYRLLRVRGLKQAAENVTCEDDVIRVIEEFDLHPLSEPAKKMDKLIQKWKAEKLEQDHKQSSQDLHLEKKRDEMVAQFCIDNEIPQETVHVADNEIDEDLPF